MTIDTQVLRMPRPMASRWLADAVIALVVFASRLARPARPAEIATAYP